MIGSLCVWWAGEGEDINCSLNLTETKNQTASSLAFVNCPHVVNLVNFEPVMWRLQRVLQANENLEFVKMLVTSQESESAKYLTRGIRLLCVWNISAPAWVAWSSCSARLGDSDTALVNIKIVEDVLVNLNAMQCMGGRTMGRIYNQKLCFHTPLYLFPCMVARILEIFPRYCFRILSPWQFRNVNIWNAIQWNIRN